MNQELTYTPGSTTINDQLSLGIVKKINILSSPEGCSKGEGMRLQARCGLRRLAWDRQSETPRCVAKGELSPNTA